MPYVKIQKILEILVSKPLYSLLIKQIHLLNWNTELTTIPVTLIILTPGRYDFKKFQRIFLTPEWNFSSRPFVYSPGALYHWATRYSWELRPYFKSGISKSESIFYILFCPFPLIYWQTCSFSYFEKETAATKTLFILIPSCSDVVQLIEKPFFNYNHIQELLSYWNIQTKVERIICTYKYKSKKRISLRISHLLRLGNKSYKDRGLLQWITKILGDLWRQTRSRPRESKEGRPWEL